MIKGPHFPNLVRPAITRHQPAPGGHGSPQEYFFLCANDPSIIVVAKVHVRFVMFVDEDNIPKVASLYEAVPAMYFLRETIGGENVVCIVPCT